MSEAEKTNELGLHCYECGECQGDDGQPTFWLCLPAEPLRKCPQCGANGFVIAARSVRR